jgi:hypothetical protein
MEQSGLKWGEEEWKRARSMQGALAYMKQIDPTRGSFIHQGVIGDIWAVNSYLNFIPLQEAEEWMSAWARSGTKPYLPSSLARRSHFVHAWSRALWPGRRERAVDERVRRDLSWPRSVSHRNT